MTALSLGKIYIGFVLVIPQSHPYSLFGEPLPRWWSIFQFCFWGLLTSPNYRLTVCKFGFVQACCPGFVFHFVNSGLVPPSAVLPLDASILLKRIGVLSGTNLWWSWSNVFVNDQVGHPDVWNGLMHSMLASVGPKSLLLLPRNFEDVAGEIFHHFPFSPLWQEKHLPCASRIWWLGLLNPCNFIPAWIGPFFRAVGRRHRVRNTHCEEGKTARVDYVSPPTNF